MTTDVEGLIRFYKSPLGRLSRHFIHEQVSVLAGDVTGLRVVGLGFASPYLRGALIGSERVLAFMPARQGASAWPREGPSRTVLCDPLELPLTDSAVDLIIVVHALEHAPDPEELMRELWRVCAPSARLVIVVPRRRGTWAGFDNTPFGFGRPYSRSQLDRLLRDHSFTPLAWRDTLHFPPVAFGPVLKSARLLERGGRMFHTPFAGVQIVSAKKELFPAIARRKKATSFLPQPDLAPQAALHPHRGPLED